MAVLNPTQLTPPRVSLLDDRTGALSREWYRFFLSLLTATQDNQDQNDVVPDVSSLLASYDSMLATLAQNVDQQPDAATAAASLDEKIDDLAQSVEIAPRQELGTMAALQQANVPWLKFDTTPDGFPTGAAANGALYWNDADNAKTLNLVMEDTGGVIQQIGEETYYRVKATAAITNGQVVMFTGTLGASGGLKAAPASGLSPTQSEFIMGVATQDIARNGWGYVTWFGEVRGVDTTGGTESWADGDVLYYNPAVAGALTKFVPTAPNPKVLVASVVHAASNGVLFVRPTFGSALGATDSNVEISGLTNGDVLQYDGAQSRWENVPASSIAVSTATNIAGGAANRIVYQTGASTTSFIAAPSVANTYLEWSGSAFQWSANPSGTVTSVAMTAPTGLTVSGSPITSAGTLAVALQTGYSIPTTASQANWDTAYTDRLKWDGGATGLVAATGRASLGATTLGSNLFTITNPGAVTFPRFNADNTVSALDAATFRAAIGAGTGNGTVTSIDVSGGTTGLTTSGGPVTGSGTITLSGTLSVSNGGTGAATFSSGYLLKGNGASAVSASVIYDNGTSVGIGTTSPTSKLDVNGRVSLTGGEDNQLQWSNNGQTWRINNSSGGLLYLYDVTAAKFPFKVSAGTGNDTLVLTTTGVGVGTGSPHASAMLDVQSTTKGLRLPNMTTTEKNAISSPAAGLMVFDTTLGKACLYTGSAWQIITSV